MDILFVIILGLSLLLLVLGVVEQKKNERRLGKIPIRVNVNGIRGKSTATRFITSVLHEAGYETMGKTTGTAARKMFPGTGEELEIKRKPEGANIKEQLVVIKEAANKNMKALVCECMAVKPEYQNIYQNKMFHGNICVIVNVLEDHLDDMGPTLNEIAMAFSQTIPYNGKLIIVKNDYTPFFCEIARERNSEVYIVDPTTIDDAFLKKFDYVVFPDNVGIALAVAKALNIDEDIAYRGMINAWEDPGALKVKSIQLESGTDFTFVNAFAANEPSSTLNIWEYIENLEAINSINPVVVFNGRPDRGDRTHQFAIDFFDKMPEMTLVVMGQSTKQISYGYKNGMYPNVNEFIDLSDVDGNEVFNRIESILSNRVLFTIGNIHGDGEVLLEEIERLSSKQESVF